MCSKQMIHAAFIVIGDSGVTSGGAGGGVGVLGRCGGGGAGGAGGAGGLRRCTGMGGLRARSGGGAACWRGPRELDALAGLVTGFREREAAGSGGTDLLGPRRADAMVGRESLLMCGAKTGGGRKPASHSKRF